MAEKESDDDTIDYEFLSKYIRDDSDENKKINHEDFSKNFVSGNQNNGTEVLSREGEGESYRENPGFNKKPWQKVNDNDSDFEGLDESDDSGETIESKSSITDAKKEFIEELEDESLTVDTANRLNFDWNKK